jgi:hypothetical protein
MARRLDKTLVDYLIIAISPALIMLLVGSLVFFLIEVFYQGNFQGRLQYIFALFVFAAVLIARISIDEGRERAALFAAPLAVAVLMAVDKFVQFKGGWLGPWSCFVINCGLVGLVWWASDKLTWDCTLIDEAEEDSGEGLLEAVGLDRPDKAALQKQITPASAAQDKAGAAVQLPPQQEPAVPTLSKAAVARLSPLERRELGLIDHPELRPKQQTWWQRFVERRRRPHAPGLWVVYFSLAALPLFGIGQLFIPSNRPTSRQYAFCLLFIYTASGLGLLLTTSFLGLRRYLRQRQQEMPLSMVNLWLGVGGALIAGVMLAAILLPRPNAEYAVSELPFQIGSPDQTSSPHGVGHDGVDENKSWARGEKKDDKQSGSAPSDKQGKAPSPDGKAPPGDKKGDSGKDKNSDQPQGEKSQPQPSSQDDQGQKKSPENDKGPASRDKSDEAKKTPADRDSQKDKKTPDGSRSGEKQPPDSKTGQRPSAGRTPEKPAPTPMMPHVTLAPGVSPLMVLFKCLFYLALAVLVLYWMWKNRAKLWTGIVNFWPWLMGLWHSLFGGSARRVGPLTTDAELAKSLLPRFIDFTDPFVAGMAGEYPAEELVRYTFDALEAWARDRGHPRQPEQTPHEFARNVGSQVSSLADDAEQLADLYCQAAYAPGTLSIGNVARLPHLWRTMRAEAVPASPDGIDIGSLA